MTTTSVDDAVILPQSQGTGLSGEDAVIDASINGVLNRYVGGEYVATEYSTGLQFQNHDAANDTVEVGPGIVFVQDNSTSTGGQRSGSGNPQAESSTTSGYDTELPEGHTYAVLLPTATEISVTDSTLNEVYVDIDDVTANNSVNFEHDGSSTASPGGTSLKIGETNPDDASADTRANDDASPTFDSLTVNGTTDTDTLNANSLANVADYIVDSESELDNALSDASPQDVIYSGGFDLMTSTKVLNKPLHWIHSGDLRFDAPTGITIGSDGSQPRAGSVTINGRFFSFDGTGTAIKAVTGQQWQFNTLRVDSITNGFVIDADPVASFVGPFHWKSGNIRATEKCFHIKPEPDSSTFVEGNMISVPDVLFSTDGTPVVFEGGRWNSVHGGVHADNGDPDIIDRDSRGNNQFITNFWKEQILIHPRSQIVTSLENNRETDYRTAFESIDGMEKDTSTNGSINLTPTRVVVDSGGASGDYARLQKSSFGPTFYGDTSWANYIRDFKIPINLQTTDGPMYAVTGEITNSDKTTNHVGVGVENGDLVASVADGTTHNTSTVLESDVATGNQDIFVRHYPDGRADYYLGGWDRDDSAPDATVTSNVPTSGGFAESMFTILSEYSGSTAQDIRTSQVETIRRGW